MKCLTILIAGLVAVFLSSCSSTPKDNYNQAMESDLVEATIFMKTLNALDAGDVSKARRMAMMPVFMNLGSMRLYTTKGWGSVTTEQKEEWTKLAKQTLDYMIRHESEFDSRRLDVQQGLRGLRYLLTEPEDVRRLDELSAYFQKTQKPWPDDSH